MDNDYDITAKIEKDILEWIVENYNNIETVTPRMILKTVDLKLQSLIGGKRWQILNLAYNSKYFFFFLQNH